MKAGTTRSRYTVCWTVYLDEDERAVVLRFARWSFPAHCQLSPGQLIVHALTVYGQRCRTLAREWCDTHPADPGWMAAEGGLAERE